VEYNTARLESRCRIGRWVCVRHRQLCGPVLSVGGQAQGARERMTGVSAGAGRPGQAAGEDTPTGMAEWARHQEELLIPLLQIARRHFAVAQHLSAHPARVVAVSELHRVICEFLTGFTPGRQSVLMPGTARRCAGASDRTNAWRAPAGCLLPRKGRAVPTAVESKDNEISGRRRRCSRPWILRGKIVARGTRCWTQRAIVHPDRRGGRASKRVVVKDNQPETRKASRPLPAGGGGGLAGHEPARDDFPRRTHGQGAWRMSSALDDEQFAEGLSALAVCGAGVPAGTPPPDVATGPSRHEVVYGLGADRAGSRPERLLGFDA